MKKTQIIGALSAVVLAVTGVFATKASLKFHPGQGYFYKTSTLSCRAITCTDFNTGTVCGPTGAILYTTNNCAAGTTVTDLYVPNVQ